MKRTTIILWALGMALSIAGFVLGQVESLPPFLRIVAREYVEASSGIKHLRETRALQQGDPGFAAVVAIARADAQLASALAGAEVERFKLIPLLRLGDQIVGDNAMPRIIFTTGQAIDWPLDRIDQMLAERKRAALFRASVVVFTLGIVLQVVSFILQVLEKRQGPERTAGTA
jgi:hypothetical protein